jgi:N-methylhydantoinase A/oxoprolinase/acetone carboxylase beta subunit
MDMIEAAWAIHSVVNEHMAAATRMHATEKSIDPRRYALLAFGGGGPVHAAGVARILNLPAVISPPSAGVASAVGLLVAPPLVELARSYPVALNSIDWSSITALMARLEAQARARLAEVGVPAEDVQVERSADGRFVGQLHEIAIPLPDVTVAYDPDGLRVELSQTFFARYRALYRHLPSDMPIEFLSWRLSARGRRRPLRIRPGSSSTGNADQAVTGRRRAYFGLDVSSSPRRSLTAIETPVYSRYKLAPETCIEGPAIVEERECSVVVGPGTHVEIDPHLNLVMRL